MTKLRKLLLSALILGIPIISVARMIYTGNLVEDTVISVDSNYDLDTRRINTLSFIVSYSTSAPSNKNFDTGSRSTGTFTVADYASLNARQASVSITVASYTALSDAVLTLDGVRFKEGGGGNWDVGASSQATATDLASAIDANSKFSAEANDTVVTASATLTGTHANGWTVTSSTDAALSVSAATFGSGLDNAKVVINTVILTANTDFTPETSNAVTANNLSDAIVADSTLSGLFSSTWTAGGVVVTTATAIGTTANSYDYFSSTEAALTSDGLVGGSGSDLTLSSDQIAISNHGFGTGFAVWLDTATFTTPTGLLHGTTYYIVSVNKSAIKLATSKANASAGTAVDITAETAGGTFTLHAIPISGNPAFKWQASNDNSTFVDLSVSSVTVTSTSSSAWDFGSFPYRYLRLNYTAPTFGGADLTANGGGRE